MISTTINGVPTVDQDTGEIVSPSFEDLCDKGRVAADALDTGRWLLGEIAHDVQKQWGDPFLETFSIQVAVEKKRIYEYRNVYRFYANSAVAEFRSDNPMLRYSHYRDAMRLKTLEDAMVFLNECSALGWTVEQARIKLIERLGKPTPPQKLFDGNLAVGQITANLMRTLAGNKVVRVVIFEVSA